MNDLNAAVLVGRLTRDPDSAHTAGGTAVCKLRLAFTTRRKDPATGEWGDKSNYIDVVIWGKQGESCATNLAKGRRVCVSGRLEWREWADREGQKRQQIELVADQVQFLDRKEGGGGFPPSASDLAAESGGEAAFAGAAAGVDDDIPF